jgi:hypothetical protein
MWLWWAMGACGPSYNPAREAIEAARQACVQPSESSAWSCPMHPEIQEDEPGPCPECGMPLVKEEP